MTARRCSACGASVDVPATVRSATCSFCGSALVDEEADRLEPVDRVVPFRVSRDNAGQRLRAFLAGRWFAPEAIRRASKPDELREVLVPFWAFDAVARTRFSARVGVVWYRTETYTVTVKGKTEVRTRQVREVEWFGLDGSHVRQWYDHLVSASRGLLEVEANALEPFDLGESLPYAQALVAGVAAERSTVSRAEAARVATQELANLGHALVAREHLPGDEHRDLETVTTSSLDPPRLVLLPVWVASVRTAAGAVRLLVNGQTGEVASSRIPTSWAKVAAVVLLIAAIGLVVVAIVGLS
jgi:hypothetical protein